MKFRSTWLLLLAVSACPPPLGAVRIAVIFENESRTQCIKVSARNASGSSVNANPSNLPREGKDSLVIGLSETPELLGEIRVTISRFTSADCSGTAFASETKTTTLVHGAPIATLEFRYGNESGDGGPDGGLDAGSRDGGNDAGCDTSACGNAPGNCELGSVIGCGTDGGCRFASKPVQAGCDGGVCNSAGICIAEVCTVLSPGAPCDDLLPCTDRTFCSGSICQGQCSVIPSCNVPEQQLRCDPVTPTACALRADRDFISCTSTPGGQCLDGGCVPWLALVPPLNFPSQMRDVPYPTSGWVLVSPDGGTCDTIINTSGNNAAVQQFECGLPSLTSTLNDAGVMVITTQSLDVGPLARLQFIGGRPVQLVVLGDAILRGIVSVAPLLGGQDPSGNDLAACNPALPGTANRQGGGGGGFGAPGGRGGENGGQGGGATSMLVPLRGGCSGATGYRSGGMILGGAGGGALQLIVAGTLTMPGGTVTAGGGGGSPGTANNEGGGGGGSGGTLIIEGGILNLTGGAVTANGGGGGEGGDDTFVSLPGALGPLRSIFADPAADGSGGGGIGGIGGDDGVLSGGPGGNAVNPRGGGGGGGAAGVVFIRATNGCTPGGVIISGFRPMSLSCN